MGPGDLHEIMARLGASTAPGVIVGTETGDDAGVYRLDDERALVVTADFITPVCDDPYRFGEVAAANSLSDVFAMGGQPLVAIALCTFPKELDSEVASEILAGGQAKAREAGAVVIGGHTVRNAELLYGLAVTGTVHPDRVLRNVGARPGDALVLTKPLGTGLLINGRRKGLGSDEDFSYALASMARLNRAGSLAAQRLGAHAMTDITGFGLAGHALKMALGSSVRLRFDAGRLPLLGGALALSAAGVTTGSTKGNRAVAAAHLRSALGEVPPLLDAIFHDPQTSGGLLIALPAARAAELIDALGAEAPGATVVGEVVEVGAGEVPGLELAGDATRFRPAAAS